MTTHELPIHTRSYRYPIKINANADTLFHVEIYPYETQLGHPRQSNKLPILQYMDDFDENSKFDKNSRVADNQSVIAEIDPNFTNTIQFILISRAQSRNYRKHLP